MATPTLLSLPPELQNRIYHLAVIRPNGIQMQHHPFGPREDPQLALLSTCKEIHRIVKPIYYGCNTFIFTNTDHRDQVVRYLRKFMTTLGPETLLLCCSLKLEVARLYQQRLSNHRPFHRCNLVFEIDVKNGAVSSTDCQKCGGAVSREDRLLQEVQLREKFEWCRRRPSSRNWPERLAKEVADFMRTTTSQELKDPWVHGW